MSDLATLVRKYLAALEEYEEERMHRHPSPHRIDETRRALDVVEEELRTAVQS